MSLSFSLLLSTTFLVAPGPVLSAAAVNDGTLELAGGGRSRPAELTAVGAQSPLRTGAWRRFTSTVGPAVATWDRNTAVPSRLMLAGLAAPGTMASANAAELFAHALLRDNLELLAPGSNIDDFVLVGSDHSAGIRSVGFAQTFNGMRVLGGQVSFRFKFDRLVMVASEALPDVHLRSTSGQVADSVAQNQALLWLQADTSAPLVTRTVEGPFVLPIPAAAGTRFEEVLRVTVAADSGAGRWDVFVAADDGHTIARRQTLLFGSSSVSIETPVVHPGGNYAVSPARRLSINTSAGVTQTNNGGLFDYPGNASASTAFAFGPFVQVQNATGEPARFDFTAIDAGSFLWSDPGNEEVDAQLTAYVHAQLAKDYVRNLAPDLTWLDNQIEVNVNIADECNANSDGDTINFYQSSPNCQNTGRIPTVIYHEFAHSVHVQSVIPGVGQFNVGLSEGVSDYLSSTITGDSAVGRGFDYTDAPLRENDPPNFEYRWPEDSGEVHDEGQIIAGALWDLRKIMIQKLGETAGIAYTDRVYYQSTRRASNVPSMYPEALLLDDDDGNLLNGTPNVCEINAAYGPHGLYSPGEGNEDVFATLDQDGSLTVEVVLSVPDFPNCPIDATAEISWRDRAAPAQENSAVMSRSGNSYTANIQALAAGSVLEYRVQVTYNIGAVQGYPKNRAAPWYEFFFGDVTPIRCLSDGWAGRAEGFGADNWRQGDWLADNQSSDPTGPYAPGPHIYQQGGYIPGSNSGFVMDAVNIAGRSNVRLQYYRWLSVEDAFFDQANITANGENVWSNQRTAVEQLATVHHVDEQWRFHDIDLSEFIADQEVSIRLGLAADGGLEFGGWTAAQLCIVEFDAGAQPCGNGLVEPAEQCDDGNIVAGDGCDELCQLEPDTGGTDSDSGPTDSDGGVDTEGDPALDGELTPRGCVCSSSGSEPEGMLLFACLFGLAGLRRRYRG